MNKTKSFLNSLIYVLNYFLYQYRLGSGQNSMYGDKKYKLDERTLSNLRSTKDTATDSIYKRRMSIVGCPVDEKK